MVNNLAWNVNGYRNKLQGLGNSGCQKNNKITQTNESNVVIFKNVTRTVHLGPRAPNVFIFRIIIIITIIIPWTQSRPRVEKISSKLTKCSNAVMHSYAIEKNNSCRVFRILVHQFNFSCYRYLSTFNVFLLPWFRCCCASLFYLSVFVLY